MKKMFWRIILISLVLVINNCGEKMIKTKAKPDYVRSELAKLAPVNIDCDLSHLTDADQQVLNKLVKAATYIDALFLRQVDPDNPELRKALFKLQSPHRDLYLEMFDIMFGSWNRLDHDKPFINQQPKPAGAGYYPPDMGKAEFENYLAQNPDQESVFESEFTVIRRRNGQLTAIPYHIHYQPLLEEICQLLKEAADITADKTLAKYLKLRAADFKTDDYYASDMAWLDLAGDLEVVIGPYEVYEDKLFGYKAAYEAFICMVDHKESNKLAEVTEYLVDLEKNLPLPDKYKNFERGLSSPIKVVNEVFSAGDTKAGIQTTAFNLPNDERVREAKGSKKVLLKNIARAKYDQCWIPIANTILADKPLQHVSFDAYFNLVLMHEISHGLGPGNITLSDGSESTVSNELQELYPVIEECKADILGLYNLLYLMDKGLFNQQSRYTVMATYLGGMYRSIRFGINEAHGGGVAIQFNYLVENKAVRLNKDRKLIIDESRVEPVVKELAHKILMIQAQGDYQAATELIEKYRIMTPLMQEIVDQLKQVPVDINPSYQILE